MGILVDIAPLSSGNWTYYVNGTEVAHGAFAHVNGLNDFGVDQMYPVALGNNTVVMMFNDTAGNSVVVSLTAIYSTGPIITAPTSTIYTDQGSVYELINGPDMAPLTTGNVSQYVDGILVHTSDISGMVGGQTDFSQDVDFGLNPGTNVFVITINDSAGNSETFRVTIVYSTGPVIDITSPVTIVSPSTSASPSYTNQNTVQVTGTLTDIAPLESGNWTYYVNGTEVAHGMFANINGNEFSVDQPYPLQVGNNTVVMMFNDTAGNSITVEMTAIYSTGPVIDITSPVTIVSPSTSASPSYTNQNSVQVTGTLTDIAPLESGNWTYYVNGTEVAQGAFAHVNGLNDFGVNHMYPVALGNNTVVMMFNDTAGNSVVVRETVIYDMTKPMLTITSPGAGAWYNKTTLTVTWASSDEGSGIAYYLVSLNGTQQVQTMDQYYVLNDLTAGWYERVGQGVR